MLELCTEMEKIGQQDFSTHIHKKEPDTSI